MNFQWRGNVRELENLVQHMSILYSGKKIEVNDLPEKFLSAANNPEKRADDDNAPHADARILPHLFPAPSSISSPEWNNGRIDFNKLVNDFETQLIVQAMKISSGNKKEAARLLNLKRTTLLEKIKKKELAGLWEDTQENGDQT
jgi:DNA-binding NtrC family response regulator